MYGGGVKDRKLIEQASILGLLAEFIVQIAEIGFPNIIIVTASSESYLETEYKQVSSIVTDTRNYIYFLFRLINTEYDEPGTLETTKSRQTKVNFT